MNFVNYLIKQKIPDGKKNVVGLIILKVAWILDYGYIVYVTIKYLVTFANLIG